MFAGTASGSALTAAVVEITWSSSSDAVLRAEYAT
jgi:hypothetical protein